VENIFGPMRFRLIQVSLYIYYKQMYDWYNRMCKWLGRSTYHWIFHQQCEFINSFGKCSFLCCNMCGESCYKIRSDNWIKSFYFLILHPVAHYTTILNEGTTFHNKLWVFSLLFFATLHVSVLTDKSPEDGLLIGRNM
jgi:hypothetical protein